jgi:broad specificity phosphatase PhoE
LAHQPNVVVVRHGETEWSKSGQHTGRTDIPLTAKGRQQAEQVGELLTGRSFSLVLTSPLDRAEETCRLAGFADEAQVDPDLIEWDYGDMEGRTTADIRDELPGWTVWSGPIPGGESIDHVAARADRVIARCLAAGGDVALFGHGHALRILAARWCELAPREGSRLPLGTATLCQLGWEHEYRTLSVWNERLQG